MNHKVCKQAYFRNDDDTFILFNGTNGRAEIIFNHLNRISKNICFTFKTQIENKLNILDRRINIANNKFNLYIYRKLAQPNTNMPNYSNH